MKITVGQFAAGEDPELNAAVCRDLMTGAADSDLLVLPEGVLVRYPGQPERKLTGAQPLDGPFVSSLLDHSRGLDVTVVVGIHEPANDTRVYNTLVALRRGEIVAVYRKLHLYDAFADRESDHVMPGVLAPPVFACRDWSVGLMTCYDVRFPEMARLLVDQGAEIIALPAAWVRGIAKERHWELMVAARALENTCYVAASGECGIRNIGASMIVDPLATVVARLGARPGAVSAEIDKADLAAARAALPVLANRRLLIDPAVRPAVGVL